MIEMFSNYPNVMTVEQVQSALYLLTSDQREEKGSG